MNALLVALLTVTPVLIGLLAGRRIGALRIGRWISRSIFSLIGGVTATLLGYQLEWFRPLGLVTPILLGLLVVSTVSVMTKRAMRWSAPLPSSSQRIIGSLAGATIGLAVAVAGWQTVLFATHRSAADQSPILQSNEPGQKVETSLHRLATIAHAGFLQHVPVAGPLTDDLIAVGRIMDTPIEVRKQFAISRGWEELADLPSFRAIINDETLIAEIEAASSGSFVALYRLQRHPLVIEFSQEQELKDLASGIDVQHIAEELSKMQGHPGIAPAL
ncbi:MAG: hypothetical protein AAGD11_07080 [Planctomycetota bacterium]